MRHAALACLAAAVLAPTALAARDQRYINGLFVSAGAQPIELIAFAEAAPGRRLKMVQGTLEDVPTVGPHQMLRVLCSLPLWKPAGVMITSAAIFSEDDAETRRLPFATRMLNIYALELRLSDLERTDVVARLLRSVNASDDNPGYVFIILHSDGLTRFFPFRLAIEQSPRTPPPLE